MIREGRRLLVELIVPRGSSRRRALEGIVDRGRRHGRPSRIEAIDVTSTRLLLVVDDHRPTPHHDSGSARLAHILRTASADGWHVLFVAVHRHGNDDLHSGAELGIDTFLYADQLPQALRLVGPRIDCCWFAHVEQYSAFKGVVERACTNASMVFDTVDLHSTRLRAQAAFSGHLVDRMQARRTARMERAAVADADVTVVVSSEEEAVVRSWSPKAHVVLVPNMHSVPDISRTPNDDRDIVTFVGSFTHQPNVDAARYIVHELAPRLHALLPNTEIVIVGSDPPVELLDLSETQVRFTGWIADLEEIYARTRVVVAPLLYGAGLKGKVGEAMAHGVPVVTTPVGAEGFGAIDGTHLIVAEDPATFANRVRDLYIDDDLWQRIAGAGRDLVRDRFSTEAGSARVRKLLGDLP